jgi:hypothetical protein
VRPRFSSGFRPWPVAEEGDENTSKEALMRVGATVIVCLIFSLTYGLARGVDQAAPAGEEVVSLPRAEFEEMKAKVERLEQEVSELKSAIGRPTEKAPAEEAAAPAPPAPSGAGGRALLLPDISLIVQAKGKLSSDRGDEDRDRVRLSEAELGIQGYVYPNVKADAFITMSPAEDEAAQAEEAYLTYLGLRKGLNLYVGKKHVPFGRTNVLHNHSWLYVNPPKVLQNLVGEESLSGEGLGVSYLLPTKGDLFAQLDLGTWTGAGAGEPSDLPDIVKGPGANFADRFNTARLWTSYPLAENSELELGGSYAGGAAAGEEGAANGRARLAGLDLTYRHFGEGTSRLLLRGEGVWRRQTGEMGNAAKGYYLFGNYRKTKYASLGLLYDWTEFPQAPDLHESALSLILTKQLSEQYYVRLQGTHGSRPGDDSYDELLLQWVWGEGPHTHNLE